MSAKLKLATAASLLVLLGAGVACYKVCWLGVPFWTGEQVREWQIEAKVSFFATGKRVQARLALPSSAVGSAAGESGSLGYHFFVEKDSGKSRAVWSAKQRSDAQSLYYWVRVAEDDSRGVAAVPGEADEIDQGLPGGMAGVAAKGVVEQVQSVAGDPDSVFVQVFEMFSGEAGSQELALLRKSYDKEYHVGGDVMLGIDLLRLAGVPARVAYGLELKEEHGVQQPLRFVEYHDSGYWKVRDPRKPTEVLDGNKVFIWHRGGGPMLDVNGGENSGVVFTLDRELVPQSRLTDLKDSPLFVSTILGLPQAERSVFRYLVLIPLGAFVVVLMRNVVGVPTLGTFMPVLIALALLEIPLGRGLVMFSVLIGVGLWFRFLLSRLNLLVVPRVAACVVIVTLLMMVMSVVSHRLGFGGGVQITLFPMIILAWTIERMSLIWEEEGRISALTQVGGSMLVAVIAFLFMNIGQVRYWAFYFPELLLVLLAGILMLGRYTGYRLSELVRFKYFTES